MHEFRHKMGSLLPKLTKDGQPNSRTEFDGLSDFMQYVSTLKSDPKVAKSPNVTPIE